MTRKKRLQSDTEEAAKGKNSREARVESETVKDHCLVNCSPWLDQPAFLFNSEPLAHWSHHPQWASYGHFNHRSQEKVPYTCQQVNLMKTIPQGRFLFPGVSIWYQVDKKLTNTSRLKVT